MSMIGKYVTGWCKMAEISFGKGRLCLHDIVYKCCEVRNKWREVISLPHCDTMAYSPIIDQELGSVV